LFYENFLKLCKTKNIPQYKVLSDLGLSTGNIYKWKTGSSVNSDLIIKIADYFNVSTDYIILGKDNLNTLSEREIEILNILRKLKSEKLQDRFIGKAEMIAQEMIDSDVKKSTGS
jgi:transcriptional regulator with XRE-family HTH domain